MILVILMFTFFVTHLSRHRCKLGKSLANKRALYRRTLE